MAKAALVIMAAGIGSRFGGGIKQLASVGPNGEIIMDYSVYDAIEAGFDKVVFVIRKDIEEEFREKIGERIAQAVETEYVFQELDDIPAAYRERFAERTKPWGTGQAILCCKGVVDEPFLIINADDYYGKEAYRTAYQELTREKGTSDKLRLSMVGFVLENTLSDNGTVTRGVCRTDDRGMLLKIKETYEIARRGGAAVGLQDGREVTLPLSTAVSMNMWGADPGFFPVLEERFERFLAGLSPKERKKEYLLPTIVGELLADGMAEVKVLASKDHWFGVTYKEDRDSVVASIRQLVEDGVYPRRLYG